MTRLTAAEKAAMAEKAAKERNARIKAWVVLIFCALASLAGNVMAVWDKGQIGIVISAFVPTGLLACTELFYTLGTIRNKWVVYPIMTSCVSIATWVSYWHIVSLVDRTLGNHMGIAYLFPLMVDIPMIMAGYIIATFRVNVAKKRGTAARKRTPQGKPVQLASVINLPA